MKSRLSLLFAIMLPVYLLAGLHSLLADDAVVGDGTPASCTEAAFDAALAVAQNGGGTITFNCGGPATLVFTSQKIITTSVAIDGNDQIMLSGGNSTSLFSNDANLTLQNITLTDGYSSSSGGAIANFGDLTLSHVTIRNSESDEHGGGIWSYQGTAELTSVTLNSNTAVGGGGGIYNILGTIMLTDATLSENTANSGGGFFNSGGTATLSNVTLSDNAASESGGGFLNFDASTATLSNVILSGNSANTGGGGFLNGNSSTAVLSNTTLSDNTAVVNGGGIFNANTSTATLTNMTLSGNSSDLGGGIYNNATITLTHVTLSDNSASSFGGGIFNVLDPNTHLMLKNSIVANSISGDDCSGQAADEALFSLWSDDSCTFTNGSGSQPNTDPLLGPLADNGGSTLTHMLLSGSPAIDMGTAVGAPTTDQRGLPRPYGAAYDIGAVEVQPTDNLFYLYLPLVVKP